MTRFARAKGSKSSNERVPEKATSWHEMKQQIQETKLKVEENKKLKEISAIRAENYNNFLKENDDKEPQWADFPGQLNKTKEKNISKMKAEVKADSHDNTVAETHTENTLQEPYDSDGPPEEQNAKVEPNIVVVKKKKVKKPKAIKINTSKRSTVTEASAPSVSNSTIKQNAKNTLQKKKKSIEELTEAELKKINKKVQIRLKQMEKKKKFKAQKSNEDATVNGTPKPLEKLKKELPSGKNPEDLKKSKTKTPKKGKPKPETWKLNGKEVPIVFIDGFPVKKEDGDRITLLKRKMISKGIPRSEVNKALKLERRKAEKALARERKKVCFNCRTFGHLLSECPELEKDTKQETFNSGVCFKCGSTEHTHFECKVVRTPDYKFATCFICKEQGHISKQCPDNARGMYPKGGACNVCGEVTHLKKDCPKYQAEQESANITLDTMNDTNIEKLDGENPVVKKMPKTKTKKMVKF